MYIDPQRQKCDKLLEKMQKDPAIKCDIVKPAMYLSTDKLIEHTNAYIDYLKRAYS